MSNELEFQWGLYIGKHMKETLLVRVDNWEYIEAVSGITGVYIILGNRVWKHKEHNSCAVLPDEIKPQLKSLESLTDSEIAYFLYGKELPPFAEVCRVATNVWVEETIFGVTETVFRLLDIHREKFTQDQLNRLHSKHRSENEKALLKAGLIEIVE